MEKEGEEVGTLVLWRETGRGVEWKGLCRVDDSHRGLRARGKRIMMMTV